MADLSVTVADIAAADNGLQTQFVQLGEAATQGMALYQSSSDQKWYKAVNSDAAKDEAGGILLTKGTADGYGLIATVGPLDIGATLTQGVTYYLSQVAGGVMPEDDLQAGDLVTRIGVALSTSTLQLDFYATGVTHT